MRFRDRDHSGIESQWREQHGGEDSSTEAGDKEVPPMPPGEAGLRDRIARFTWYTLQSIEAL